MATCNLSVCSHASPVLTRIAGQFLMMMFCNLQVQSWHYASAEPLQELHILLELCCICWILPQPSIVHPTRAQADIHCPCFCDDLAACQLQVRGRSSWFLRLYCGINAAGICLSAYLRKSRHLSTSQATAMQECLICYKS